jgi:threonine aldolase
MNTIDLRSDTVTQPSLTMRKTVLSCDVGDDVYKEDKTICLLEEKIASIFKKESALFFPTGTMCNLTAILTWCPNRGSEIIVGDKSHIFLYEQSSASQFGGVSYKTIPNLDDGTIDIENIKLSIRENDIHEPITSLICIENTHNACGGQVLSIDYLQNLQTLSKKKNIPIHMDGARIWNALVYLGKKPEEIAEYYDSISVCLSKGLGAPVGSLLIGTKDFIGKARRIRKALGGGMRQVGILGAMGLEALNNFYNGTLQKDHERTKHIANNIVFLHAFQLQYNVVTNIIFIKIVLYDKSWNQEMIAEKIYLMLKEQGILVSVWTNDTIRIVFHKDINNSDMEYILLSLKEISSLLVNIDKHLNK